MASFVSLSQHGSAFVHSHPFLFSASTSILKDQGSQGGAGLAGKFYSKPKPFHVVTASSSDKDDFSSGTGKKPSGPLLKAAWYGSELLGQLAAALSPSKQKGDVQAQKLKTDGRPIDRQQAAVIIRKDYESCYFVTGDMTTSLYANDCEYADPFVSFKGTDRFIRNVSNLGKFMLEANLDITDWKEEQDRIAVGWRFRCVLDLPWTPTLAASGQNTYVFGDNGQVVRHIERWNISPVDGLRQLVRPGRRPASKSGASKK